MESLQQLWLPTLWHQPSSLRASYPGLSLTPKIIIHHQYSLYHGCYPLHKSYSQVKGIWSTWNHVINYVDMQTPRLNCCQNDKPLQPTKMIFVIKKHVLLICNILVSFPNDTEAQQSRREVPWRPNQWHPGTLTLPLTHHQHELLPPST